MMGIQPFGFILLMVILCIIIKNKQVSAVFKIFFMVEMIFACGRLNFGYFIKIGGREIEYNDVLLGILFFLSIYVIAVKRKINKRLFFVSSLLVLSAAIGIIGCVVFPANVSVVDFSHSWDLYFRGDSSQLMPAHYSIQAVLMFIRVVIFAVIMNAAVGEFDYNTWMDIAGNVLKFLRAILVYGVIEAIAKFVLKIDTNEYLIWFFGRGISTGGGVTRLQGLCREPSYYALALFNFMVLSLFMRKAKGEKRLYDNWMIVATIIGCISTSFSFVLCLGSVLLLWMVLKMNAYEKKMTIKHIIIVAILIVIMLTVVNSDGFIQMMSSSSFTVFRRVATSITQIRSGISGSYLENRTYSSEASRLIGSIISLRAGLSRPLFGLGIGTTYCFSGLVSIIANIGLIGLFLWLYMLFRAYVGKINWKLGCCVLLPVLLLSDLYTLYDTGYLIIIPLMAFSSGKNAVDCD
jgi:hypothetical protein